MLELFKPISLSKPWFFIEEEKRQKRDDEYFLELIASDSFKDASNLESNGRKGSDLMVFSFATIVTATNDFASENKLGEGGFGPVYKVLLSLIFIVFFRKW